jgi:hypothetical protein
VLRVAMMSSFFATQMLESFTGTMNAAGKLKMTTR